MSWAGFKKAINRTSTKMLMKAGYIETTVDPQYDTLQRKFSALEQETQKLQKEARSYLDSLRQISNSQLEIVETLSSFYEDTNGDNSGGSTNATAIGHYTRAVREIHQTLTQELDEPYQITVIEPISRFNGYFSDINEAMRKREHKKLDYDLLRANVKKLQDRISRDPASLKNRGTQDHLCKLEKSLMNAQECYELINGQLKRDLPKLLKQRVPNLDPSFESFIGIQAKYCNDSYLKLNDVQNYIDAASREEYAHGRLDERVDDILTRMQQLNITSSNPVLNF